MDHRRGDMRDPRDAGCTRLSRPGPLAAAPFGRTNVASRACAQGEGVPAHEYTSLASLSSLQYVYTRTAGNTPAAMALRRAVAFISAARAASRIIFFERPLLAPVKHLAPILDDQRVVGGAVRRVGDEPLH